MRYTHSELDLNGGLVTVNPIPSKDAMDEVVIDNVIQTALKKANAQGIRGKDSTPFLLDRVKSLTGGDSLVANIALVCHNAEVEAQTAVALTKA